MVKSGCTCMLLKLIKSGFMWLKVLYEVRSGFLLWLKVVLSG